MQLEELGLKKAEITKLNKKNFFTVEDVQKFFPRVYHDFSEVKELDARYDNTFIAVVGCFERMETQKTNKTLMLKAKVRDKLSGKKLNVMWIGSYYLKNIIKNWVNEDVIVCGKLTYSSEYHSFHMDNPLVFSNYIEKNKKVFPIYTKMSGISEEWMGQVIEEALEQPLPESTPKEIVEKYKLLDIKTAYKEMHTPSSPEMLIKAQHRIIFDDLYQFATLLNKKNQEISKGSVYNIKSTDYYKEYMHLLPFRLTKSQQDAIQNMFVLGREGRRINALVQGDVGSGKTVVAFSMMFLFVSSGYQAALMAPTDILAKQHYEELKGYADKIGVRCAFLGGSLKAKEKNEILKGIQNGEIQLVVGTHSVISDSVTYKDLALAVVDEEHRFGVEAEEKLFSKSDKGIHTITMSATPIPRTITDTLFSDNMKVYDLERPAGRQEVQTAIYNNDEGIYNFIEKQVKEGRQAYVVCPLIEDSASESRRNILSVERVEDDYKKRFEMSGIRVTSVTGKTDKEESATILNDFKDRKIDVLISTTVIEVGVNNPNVSTIVISNAEMFGVAQLHQLRGRVGRGQYKGYCILKSADRDNDRLKLLCSTTNGYELAEEDAKLRGPGDILGNRQSGNNREIELVLKYPKVFRIIKNEISKMC